MSWLQRKPQERPNNRRADAHAAQREIAPRGMICAARRFDSPRHRVSGTPDILQPVALLCATDGTTFASIAVIA
ncbi:hypothetical protein ASF90_11965 [Xanthomonas sp. Leaf148]|nr:hypothetical protein ASF90_11965 [Xanthomonas sp. Leaf148]